MVRQHLPLTKHFQALAWTPEEKKLLLVLRIYTFSKVSSRNILYII